MKEETAQESSFLSIFKDDKGRWYSENFVFVTGTVTCIFIVLITALICIALALIGAFMHADLNATIVALGATNTGLIGTLQGILAFKKNKATQMTFDKDLKNKELDNVQPSSN